MSPCRKRSRFRAGYYTSGTAAQSLATDTGLIKKWSELTKIKTWTDRLGRSGLRSFTDEKGRFWLEQNAAKPSKWAKLARKGHEIAWEFEGPGGAYTGRMLIDGEIYTPSEATKKGSGANARTER